MLTGIEARQYLGTSNSSIFKTFIPNLTLGFEMPCAQSACGKKARACSLDIGFWALAITAQPEPVGGTAQITDPSRTRQTRAIPDVNSIQQPYASNKRRLYSPAPHGC